MKTAACIPIHGRLPLVRQTISRLIKKNGVHTVLCAGDTDEEKEACESSGATFIFHANQPLGKKWNALFQLAGEINPDNVLFVGSSDWVSDNWLPVMYDYMERYDMVGLPGFYLLDIGNEFRVCHWPGYAGPRQNEPIGIGRVINSRVLKKMKWKPFIDEKNRSLDFQMYQSVLGHQGKTHLLKSDEIKSISISTSLWGNLHQFEDHWNNKLKSERVNDHSFLMKYFPESFKIFA